ncbi:hypothetical protein MYCSP_19625 [Mycobacteroides saopaulense]|uniref:hypothetical protein n=1 Tax=Mycobacteroides saopaulense TaxID=1578165 RepID=UPI0007225EBC|nr:hypothetical protein [Mycobacteroides saopaulense]ALR13252.1 hypothetical protein MYCSP_19625 [Mycobacteroides saopaulense]
MWRNRAAVAVQVIACALLLTGSAYLYMNVPKRTDSYAPLLVHGTAPAPTAGRNLSVTVHRVFSAPEVRAKSSVSDSSIDTYQTKGRYIAIDLSYETVRMPDRIDLQLEADHLNIDRENFAATKAFGQPGVSVRKTWVFDVPAPPKSLNLLAIIFPDNEFRMMQGWVDSQLLIAIPPEMIHEQPLITLVNERVVP